MRILHTSDFHLGQTFHGRDRQQEHQMALDWLLTTIQEKQADVIIVAGDIFDVGNPPNYARKMYYYWLSQLLHTPCRHIVIVGGNHDSPSMLEASRELLDVLNIYVVGSAPAQMEDALLKLKDKNGTIEAVIAAVPFLRDRDLREGGITETSLDRIQTIQKGIQYHYEQMGDLAQAYALDNVPILCTGHLYASGAQAGEEQKNIYIGNVENIVANSFPSIFSYVALGHIHRPQSVGNVSHVRYSGSLIPLSYSETKDEKSVCLLDYKGAKLLEVGILPVPTFRRLKTLKGTLSEVEEKLPSFAERQENVLPSWVEIQLEGDQMIPDVFRYLVEAAADLPLEIVSVKSAKRASWQNTIDQHLSLDTLADDTVFLERCKQQSIDEAVLPSLIDTYQELRSKYYESKAD